MSSFDSVLRFLDELKTENIVFKRHFEERIKQRPINKGMTIKLLKQKDRLLKVEEQSKGKYKVWLKLSNKYNLVLIIAISKKDLYIITGWNTNTKWQKSIQK